MLLEQTFVALDSHLHDLKGFDCGKPSMNVFLARHAVKHTRLGLSRTWVLPEVSEEKKKPIAAWFTLAASTVVRKEIPATQSLPAYPVPVVMLARLAINRNHQGRGLGDKTLIYALRKAASLSQAGLPAYGLILDVLDDDALGFYEQFDIFQPFTDNPMRLFIPMKTVQEI